MGLEPQTEVFILGELSHQGCVVFDINVLDFK